MLIYKWTYKKVVHYKYVNKYLSSNSVFYTIIFLKLFFRLNIKGYIRFIDTKAKYSWKLVFLIVFYLNTYYIYVNIQNKKIST